MSQDSRPWATGEGHTLPFGTLSAEAFERLTLWLVRREGFERAQHLGQAGSEQGRDIQAWKDGRRFAFQCKRVKAFSAADAKIEIRKLKALEAEEQPHDVVFVLYIPLRAETRKAIWQAWGDEASCHFWVGNELDERVKRYPEIVQEFFRIPVEPTKPAFLHNLPFPSLGPLFQGRDEWLTRLHQSLAGRRGGKATAIAGKAVHGLGGVGKSRLAVEYAWRYAKDYSAALFIGAESPVDLRRNLSALCGPTLLNLPEQAAAEEAIREAAVLRWLREKGGWLLILDNVDSEDAARGVDGLLGQLQGGHVLLTGRLTRWSAEVEAFPLDLLAPPDAVAFLLARTQGLRRPSADEEGEAAEIARELGYLPLALEQAGAMIAVRRLSFAGYLEEWRTRRERLLKWSAARMSHYPASVAVTWQTSVARLSDPARRLLQRLAWLGPEPIPESLLDLPVGQPSPEENELSAFDLLVELETYALVTRSTEAPVFSVHRLVQDVTRRSLEGATEKEVLIEALGWINEAFVGDPQDVRTWPTLEPLAPHARAVIEFADQDSITEPTARLMNELGQLYDAKAQASEAEPLMRRALAIAETSFGPEHPNVATYLNNLALLLKDTNRLSEAEPLMRRALAIDETSFGPEHPNVATYLNNLATLLKDTNRLSEAEPLMRRALAIDETSFGPEHPEVATDLNNLAQLFQATNRLSEAEPLMARVVTIFERSLGENHPNVAAALNNLAALLKATNRLAEAEPLMARVVTIVEKSLGENHPIVATALNNLAQLLQDTNRLSEAEPLMRRALAIDETSFGPEHPNVARDLNNLARLLQATNRLAEAEPLMRRCVEIFFTFTRRTGHEHPHLRAAFAIYGYLLEAMGRSETEIATTLAALGEGDAFPHADRALS